jgi:hypothetical protein
VFEQRIGNLNSMIKPERQTSNLGFIHPQAEKSLGKKMGAGS